MKTVIIADIHGRPLWKQIVQQENDADRFIFLGDYFDSFDIPGIKQIDNFLDIMEFKDHSGKEVITLIGNHDIHYFPHSEDSATSGYQAVMAPSIRYAIEHHKGDMLMAYKMGEFVFSHAGISSEWMDDKFVKWDHTTMVDQINDLLHYQPLSLEYRSFKYYNYGEPNERATLSRGYGDETYQGPLWIRPKALMQANKDTQNGKYTNKETLKNFVIQVVGHTYQNEIDKQGKSTGGRYYFVDVQETSEEYMIITDNIISFNTTKQ